MGFPAELYFRLTTDGKHYILKRITSPEGHERYNNVHRFDKIPLLYFEFNLIITDIPFEIIPLYFRKS